MAALLWERAICGLLRSKTRLVSASHAGAAIYNPAALAIDAGLARPLHMYKHTLVSPLTEAAKHALP